MIIDRSVILTETDEVKELGAIEHVIRVAAGGKLVLNNTRLVLQGPNTVIIVDPGGQLILQYGAIYTGPGNAIVVEKGGRLTAAGTFMIDGGKILDKNTPIEPPTEPTEPIKPPAPSLPIIVNTICFDYSLTRIAGEPPALSSYPATKWVACEAESYAVTQMELPVVWQIKTVDFDTAGVYEVKGSFTADTLAAYGISNPDNISSTLWLTVVKPAPVEELDGSLLSIGADRNARIRLALPLLPDDVSALHIYRSADGMRWEKAAQHFYDNGNIPASYDDFLPHAKKTETKLYLIYYYESDYRPMYLRVEVVGSACAGMSNIIKLELPLGFAPGDSVNNGGTNDGDGSSGGNRGGGGQHISGRRIPTGPGKPNTGTGISGGILGAGAGISGAGSGISGGIQNGETGISGGIQSGETGISGELSGGRTSISGGISGAGTGILGAGTGNLPGGISGGMMGKKTAVIPAAASPSDLIGEAQGTVLPEQTLYTGESETEAKAQESAAIPQNSPAQRSRGVVLAAGATAMAAGAMFLGRKIYSRKKNK